MLPTFLCRGHRWLKLLLLSVLFGASAGASAMDTYDPTTGILTIPLVIVGTTAYTNVQVFVDLADVVSVGGVNSANAALNAADTYSGNQLTIPAVQSGNTIYSDVQAIVALANVRAVGGSTPTPTSAPLLTLVNPLASATVARAYAAKVVAAVWPSSPYTFGIDTLANGVLPTGMTIDLNGTLSGTPFATGKTDINGNQVPNTYAFGVCATDTFSRRTTSPCPQTTITVNPAPVTLNVATAGTGSGSVASSPAGISCGATCSASVASGTVGTLTATPASGSTFAGWSGACSGTGACVLTLRATTSVTATFNVTPPPVFVDTVTPRNVTLGHAGSCTGGVLTTTFHVASPNGITWTAAADPNTPPLGGKPLGIAPASGSVSGDVLVTITVPPQLPSFGDCSLTYSMNTFSNVYITFSDGTVIGVTVYWTFVGTT
jgi:hypothetical protein